MLDFGGNFGKEFSEWSMGLTVSFDPDNVNSNIHDYLEKHPVPEVFHLSDILF